jgi:hypothetical protein
MANKGVILGITELQARIKRAPVNLQRQVANILKAGAEDIAGEAKQRAPVDQGFLKNFISAKVVDPMTTEIVSASSISPYVEFGTRSKAKIPAGLEEYAAQFLSPAYQAGPVLSELSAKEAIFAWCKRKGIPKDIWFPIYISIMVNGIKPHPFFFVAYERIKPIIINQVEKALKDVI